MGDNKTKAPGWPHLTESLLSLPSKCLEASPLLAFCKNFLIFLWFCAWEIIGCSHGLVGFLLPSHISRNGGRCLYRQSYLDGIWGLGEWCMNGEVKGQFAGSQGWNSSH